MNFLGHIYFSENNPQLMIANLFGDFVKGRDLSMYDKQIQKGIILHREIDSYIDHHPAVLELMHKLYPSLPKVTGIAVDLFFDHILAKNWSKYHKTDLKKFISNFYATKIQNLDQYSENFLFMLAKMKEINWLEKYQYTYGLEKACNGLSKRISFENKLSFAPQVFIQFQEDIELTFEIFMKDAIPHFKEFSVNILK